MNPYYHSPDHSSNSLGMNLFPRGLAFLLGIDMLGIWPDLTLLFSDQLLPESIVQNQQVFWINMLFDQVDIHYLGVIYICCCLLVMLQRHNTLAVAFLFILHYFFFISHSAWGYGADYIAQTALFFSLLSRIPGIPDVRQAFRLQLISIYFFAGLGKSMGPTWWNGEALWKAIQQPLGPTLFVVPLSGYRLRYLWIMIGILTVVIETAYPLVWFSKSLRGIFVAAVMLMHIGIAILIGLPHFSCLMIWYNLCVWDHPLLLCIAKPIINLLGTTEPQLQVRAATVDPDTKEGGNKPYY